MGLRNAGLRGHGRTSLRRSAGRVGAVVAALLVATGTTIVFDASSFVSGSAPPTDTLSCNDSWIGSGSLGDWDSATNWSTGVPSGGGVDACISGNADVVLTDASFSIGELTVSAGSSLTIGLANTTNTTNTTNARASADLTVSSGLLNAGSLTVHQSGTSDEPGLALHGPILNSGTLTVNGVVDLGTSAASALTNEGTIGVAPGALITMDASSTIANEPDGLLAFGIGGPPGAPAASGRITNGTLTLGGSVDPVFEQGFVPPAGSEYFVDTGSSSGTFASVLHGATADYSRAGEVGLIGGGSPTTTTTSLSSSVSTGLQFAQTVQFTAAVVPVSGSNPTGSVTFFANGVPVGSAPVSTSPAGASSATLEMSSLQVGSAAITAAYSGDVVFAPSNSSALTEVVNPDATNITLTPSPTSPEPGQPVTDTATVALAPPGTGTPTGTVSFTDDGSPIAGCQALSLPSAAPLQVTCSQTYASGAIHSVTATYSGDADDAGSTASLLQSVGQLRTETTVTASSPSSTYGQSVTLTATVTPTATAPTSVSPSGTVTFYDFESNPIGTATVSTAGGSTTASLQIASLMSGLHSITATYSGDPTFGSSSSDPPVDVSVVETPTVVTVSSPGDPIVLGQSNTFTATISSSAAGATGTVQFVDNGIMIGSGTVSGGRAMFTTSSLALGAHPITAVYEGDDDFVGSSSTNTVTQTVKQASTSTALTSSDDPGLVGQTLTFTATVTVNAPGSGSPSGSVSFSDGGTPIPTCQGIALPTTPPLVAACPQAYDASAVHGVTATYSGDASFTASAGTMAESITPVPTTTQVVPSPSTSTSGQSVTFTATVTLVAGAAIPDGSVTFSVDGTALGTSTLTTTDGVTSASMLTTTLPVGADSVVASFGGSADFLPSVSTSAASVTVSRAPTTLGLLSSVNPTPIGQSTTFTATVFPATGSGETGTVSFFADGSRIGTGQVVNGQATLTVSTLPAGDHSVTATYAGDNAFLGSATPAPLLQSVGRNLTD